MAATTAIVAGVGSTVFGAVENNQARQRARGAANAVLASAPDTSHQVSDAQQKAFDAERIARQKAAGASGYKNTILTSPNAPPPGVPTGKKSLLGS